MDACVGGFFGLFLVKLTVFPAVHPGQLSSLPVFILRFLFQFHIQSSNYQSIEWEGEMS